MKKIIAVSFILFALFAFLTANNVCYAAGRTLEALNGLLGPGDTQDLPHLIKWAFGFFTVVIGGSVVLLMFVIGAIRYMASFGSAAAMKGARDQMISAILGGVILASSFIILQTINPKFINLELAPLPELPVGNGLLLVHSSGRKIPCSGCNASITSVWIVDGFKTLEYKCASKDQYPYLIYKFPETDFNGQPEIVSELACGGSWTLSGESFMAVEKTPGVYLFLNSECTQIVARDTSSISDLHDFSNKISCLKIVNDPAKKIFYGVVVHENPKFMGRCLGGILEGHGKELIEKFTPSGSSISILQAEKAPGKAGDGVEIHSGASFGGGLVYIKDSKIGGGAKGYFSALAKDLKIDFSSSSVPVEEQNLCATVADIGNTQCPGSVKHLGKYATVLISKDPDKDGKEGDEYCYVAEEGVAPAIEALYWLIPPQGDRKLARIEILRIK